MAYRSARRQEVKGWQVKGVSGGPHVTAASNTDQGHVKCMCNIDNTYDVTMIYDFMILVKVNMPSLWDGIVKSQYILNNLEKHDIVSLEMMGWIIFFFGWDEKLLFINMLIMCTSIYS